MCDVKEVEEWCPSVYLLGSEDDMGGRVGGRGRKGGKEAGGCFPVSAVRD